MRTIAATFKSTDTLEGAGVHLRRGFSHREATRFDPFLLFDDFSSSVPEHYLPGFPWHPHRGMETVTYILEGTIRHKDSLKNEGVIENGAVQWMTAGSGIIHEEMPESPHGIRGFQLWVNLPKKDKMSAPKYQDLLQKVIPEIALSPKARARVIAGEMLGTQGPLKSVAGSPLYIDVMLEANGSVSVPIPEGYTVFAYAVEGAIGIPEINPTYYASGTILLFERSGGEVVLRTNERGARFLLIAGAPLGEPVAWHGPIVMNTDEELREAFRDLQEGNFIRTR